MTIKLTFIPTELRNLRPEVNTLEAYEVIAKSKELKDEKRDVLVIDIPGGNPIAVYENEFYAEPVIAN